MSDLYWLTDEQMARLWRYFSKSHDKPRFDDRQVLSGIIVVNRNGLRWRKASREYAPKTLYNRWKQWFVIVAAQVQLRWRSTGIGTDEPHPQGRSEQRRMAKPGFLGPRGGRASGRGRKFGIAIADRDGSLPDQPIAEAAVAASFVRGTKWLRYWTASAR